MTLCRRPRGCYLTVLATVLVLILASLGQAQEPLDLFSDSPALAAGFVRLCAWNLRHINLEEQARTFLPGANDTEDFAILIATFAKAMQDLGCDLTAVIEVQPRANEANRLNQTRDRLNGGTSGPWRSDQTDIEYDDPTNPFGNLQLGLLWNSTKLTIDPSADHLLPRARRGAHP
jgi:hypothetical protein